MFNSNILDVAIGMIFIYLLLSLMCSAANEIIELMLKKRAIDLERGIRELLSPDSPSGTPDIVAKLYNHALINNLFGGTYEDSRIKNPLRRVMRTQLPSYIPARNFALALMDLVGTVPAPAPQGVAPAAAPPPVPPIEPVSGATGATVAPRAQSAAQFVLNVPPAGGAAQPPPPPVPPANPPAAPPGAVDNPLTPLRDAITTNPLLREVSRRSLITLLDAAGNDVVKARENIENWYNSSMDRVSGWYKRRAQLTILIVGLFVAIAVNVDTITIAKRLSTDKAVRESLVNAADTYAKANAQPSETPEPTSTPTSSPSGSAGTATATPSSKPTSKPLPECVKEPLSKDCNEAKLKSACEDPDSPTCRYLTNQQQLMALGLPIGWDSTDDPTRKWPGSNLTDAGGWKDQLYWHWLGWLLTALAISLGAPFWFDLLNKFIVIRSAVKPHEKSPEEESKD